MTAAEVVVPPGGLVLAVGGPAVSQWLPQLCAAARLRVSSTIVAHDLGGNRLTTGGDDTDSEAADRSALFDLCSRVATQLGQGRTVLVDATDLDTGARAELTEVAGRQRALCITVHLDVDGVRVRRCTRPEIEVDADVTAVGRHAMLAGPSDEVQGEQLRLARPGRGVVDSGIEGPAVIIGDVHGEADKLRRLLALIADRQPGATVLSVGDIGDRGPDSAGAYQVMLEERIPVVASNHGAALAKKAGKLRANGHSAGEIASILDERAAQGERAGQPQPMTRFISETVRSFARHPDADARLDAALALEQEAPHQRFLHRGRALVVHGGVRAELLWSPRPMARQVAVYGTPTAASGPDGLPVGRDSWVEGYHRAAGLLPLVVYGHIAYPQPRIERRTVGLDTGAGKDPTAPLTAAVVEDGVLTDLLQIV